MFLRVARLLTVLLTGLAATAAGALNGRVLCIGDGGHVAVEAPHSSTACPSAVAARHACCGDAADARSDAADPRSGVASATSADAHPDGPDDCTDVEADGTPVRETAAATHLAAPVPNPFAVAPPLPWQAASPTLAFARRTSSPAEHPPACRDLAGLRAIVLLV